MKDKCYAQFIQSKLLNFVAHLSKANFFYYISSSVTTAICTESNFSPIDQLITYENVCVLQILYFIDKRKRLILILNGIYKLRSNSVILTVYLVHTERRNKTIKLF